MEMWQRRRRRFAGFFPVLLMLTPFSLLFFYFFVWVWCQNPALGGDERNFAGGFFFPLSNSLRQALPAEQKLAKKHTCISSRGGGVRVQYSPIMDFPQKRKKLKLSYLKSKLIYNVWFHAKLSKFALRNTAKLSPRGGLSSHALTSLSRKKKGKIRK